MAGACCRPSHMCTLDQVNSQGLWVVLVHAQFVVNIVLPHAVRLVSEPDGSLWLTELCCSGTSSVSIMGWAISGYYLSLIQFVYS